MDEDIKRNTGVIEDFLGRIREEEKKLQEDKQAEREERQNRIDELKIRIEEQDSLFRASNDRIRSSRQRLEELSQRKGNAERDKVKYDQEMQQCYEQLQQIENQANNRLNAFGRNVPDVLRRINAQNWQGQTPVGPLGSFITLRDQEWAQVMRVQLGSLVRSFAITDPRDKTQLKKILMETGKWVIVICISPTCGLTQFLLFFYSGHMQIIVSEVDLFDYSSGEPPAQVLTVLRALDVSN